MSGIMHKIGDALHIGGDKKKEEEKHKGETAHGPEKGEPAHGHEKGEQHKEGIVDKIKDKIHGDGGKEHGQKGEKKKKHDDGHESSSSSDSD